MDLRLSNAPILLGLGIPVTINPDDPGKFGYEDSTVDYFCAAVSYNWTLKHLKLIAIHSINYAICAEGLKFRMHERFRVEWNSWIKEFLATE
jgi:adenosine deaminase